LEHINFYPNFIENSIMPQSRKRAGHHPHHESSAIPAKQRTKGRTIWAILLGIFALVMAFFAAGDNYFVLAIAAIAGAAVGYVIGKSMEADASHK
jgi:hypothetical protein